MVYTKKKRNGKNVIIILLIISVIGLTGYIIYGNLYDNKKMNSLNDDVEKLNSKVSDLKKENEKLSEEVKKNEEEKKEAESKGYINAFYYGVNNGIDPSGIQVNIKTCLTLFDDGTFTQIYIDSEGLSGTYKFENRKIILSGNNANGEFNIVSDISDDNKTIQLGNVTLNKIN